MGINILKTLRNRIWMLALVVLISVQHITPVFAAGAEGISPYAKSIDGWTSDVNCGIFDKMRNVDPYRYTNYVIGCGNNDYYGIGAAALEGALTRIMTNKNARIFCKQNLQKMRGFTFLRQMRGAPSATSKKCGLPQKFHVIFLMYLSASCYNN